MTDTINPDACQSMTQVREGVDAVDREIVALLKRRFGYMKAAARIKPTREAVRDQDRKDDVHAKVAAAAKAAGLPSERLWPVWEELMEQSIAYELELYDEMRG